MLEYYLDVFEVTPVYALGSCAATFLLLVCVHGSSSVVTCDLDLATPPEFKCTHC